MDTYGKMSVCKGGELDNMLCEGLNDGIGTRDTSCTCSDVSCRSSSASEASLSSKSVAS